MSLTLPKQLVLVILIVFLCSSSCLATPKIGVVLAGGAARGFTFVGLLQALEENGIPVDMLVGTSMGSIISAFYADGYSLENIKQIALNIDTGSLTDINIPTDGGFVDTSNARLFFDVLFEGKKLNQLQTPFHCVVTNILTGETRALENALVSDGIQASIAMPIVFPPVEIDGEHYVDGYMKNALPTDVARAHGADIVIAAKLFRELKEVDHSSILSNFWLTLWFMLETTTAQNVPGADVIITPDLNLDTYMNFQNVNYYIEEGYLTTLQHIDEIKTAILAVDPGFQFVPYKQKGFSEEEIAQRIRHAQNLVNKQSRPFHIEPQLSVESIEHFPQFGFKLAGGNLGLFNVGYRYGFGSTGGHEVFAGIAKNDTDYVEMLLRKEPKTSHSLLGVKLGAAVYKKIRFEGDYRSKGPVKWQVGLVHPSVISQPNLDLSFAAKLSFKRVQEINPYYFSLKPQVRVFVTPEPVSFFELALARPFVYGGVEIEMPFASKNRTYVYELGLGSEFKLFGLYPFRTNLGLSYQGDNSKTWKIQIEGGTF